VIADKAWFSIASDLLINLSAGWFGAVLIVPNFSEKKGIKRVMVLTTDILFATVCLVGAYILRSF
jgi:hypothetical protein